MELRVDDADCGTPRCLCCGARPAAEGVAPPLVRALRPEPSPELGLLEERPGEEGGREGVEGKRSSGGASNEGHSGVGWAAARAVAAVERCREMED